MTVIKKLELTAFGKFKNQTIELKDGLTSFVHANEWGKSTVVDFIIFMMYGHKKTKKTGLDENRTRRYLPWDGDGYISGAIELERDGGFYRVERKMTAAGTVTLNVLDAGGRTLPVTEPGEELFGIDKDTFIRTFLVRQTDIRFESTDGIETALKNLVTTGDEDVSFDKAIAELDKKQKPIRSLSVRRGRLYDLPALITSSKLELSQLNSKKDAMRLTLSNLPHLQSELAMLENTQKELEDKEDIARGNDAAALIKKLDVIDSGILSYQQKLSAQATPLSNIETEYITNSFTEYAANLSLRDENTEKMTQTADALQKLKADCPHFSLLSENEDEVKALISDKPRPNSLLAVIGAAVGIASAVLAVLFTPFMWAGLVIGAVLTVLGLTVLKLPVKIPQKYGMTQQGLQTAFENYKACKAETDRLNVTLGVYRDASAGAVNKLNVLKTTLDKIKADYGIDSIDALNRKIANAENTATFKAAIESLERQKAEVLGKNDIVGLKTIAQKSDGSDLTYERVSRLKVEVSYKKTELLNKMRELEGARIEAQKLDDSILELTSSVEKLQAEYDDISYKNDVYDLARSALLAAYEKINNSYSPILAKKVAPILFTLTGGKYEDITVDKEFKIKVKANGEYHELGYFSRGTADSVYFAVRLCIADILSEGLPLILDDPFWSLDGTRLENANKLINKIADSRQVLLFAAR